jgi:hypothetical protein
LSVWDLVVGQVVVTSMRQSAAEAALLVRGVGSDGNAWQGADASTGAMTHAWLIT